MNQEYKDLVLDQERALYGIQDAKISRCRFEGPADGESALKECKKIQVEDCSFLLRYPFWHVNEAVIQNSSMSESCRAALWYDNDVKILNSVLGGIKALRECQNVELKGCQINSTEFGWFCNGVVMQECSMTSEYPFLKCSGLEIDGLKMKGKYSFQYLKDAVIKNSYLDTKDAFWHSKNVTVMDSVVKGEYLAWYSEGLTLIRCKIIGTQPLCYAKNLTLIDCEMEGTDLAFEYSDVTASVKGNILSVKNPDHGHIEADSIGEIIRDDHQHSGADCEIIVKEDHR